MPLPLWQSGRMDEDLDEAITAAGPRLRALRRQRGITLADLSDGTGISVSTLSRLESGSRRPNLELLLPLARTYGVTLDELVGAPPTGDPPGALRPGRRPAHRRPAGAHAPGHPARHDDAAAHPPGRRHPGLQADHRGRQPPPGAHPADARGLRVALRPERAAAGRPRRARPRAAPGR